MIRFRTLGSLSLTDARDRSFEPVLARPTLVALLAYLMATPVPGGFVRRDSLLAVFWPESDQEHARHALRQALYKLRRGLGDGGLRSRGDEEIGIDTHMVWSDVHAFERRRRAGDYARAMELYRGELLPGFFLPRSPPFEDWLERERASLRERAAEAAWALAEEMERSGSLREAAHWSRRAIRILPYDEAGLRKAITLLDRIGDLAGALQLYDEFARTVRHEYESDPSPATSELVSRLRRISRTADGPRSE